MGFNLLSEGEEPLLSEPGLGQEREQPEPAAPLAPEDDEIIGIDVDGMCHVLVHMCSYSGPGHFSIWSVAILLQVSLDSFFFAPL